MRSGCAVLLAALLAGCSFPATLHLSDGRAVEAEITRSTADTVYVVPEQTDYEVPIRRDAIDEIDHPGRRVAIAGTVVGGLGLLITIPFIIAVSGDGIDCGGDGDQSVEEAIGTGVACGLAGLGLGMGPALLAAGLATGTWGWVVFARSRRAAEPPTDAGVGLRLEPAFSFGGREPEAGLGLTVWW